ncbi:unnamed protein product [Parascedosporium putredinis]|uniref:Phytochrome n=1 Tax=Parascedosporium putredinis TaxID=1442378 RepID=A0A9P1H3Q1_9PEZI|nr:unnamed protein product [Parascedosporium putredinis]CAI7996056.1 unnamed protein product [Parascedosporium putredinis]
MSKSFSSPPLDDHGAGAVVTSRFKHVVTDEGHAIITGRDGQFLRCEDEPIQAPERSSPLAFSFLDIFNEEHQETLSAHIDFVREESADFSLSGPEIFIIWSKSPEGKSIKHWCAIHINSAHPDLNTLFHNYTPEELRESTEIQSKPLRLPQRKRPGRSTDGGFEILDLMSQIQDQMAEATNLTHFLKVLVGIVKDLTGYHRVIVYQFDSQANGKVVAELVDPAHTADLYYGLHFPAADIPKQARDLYKISKTRLLHDRDLESARLVCRSQDDLITPLDMSYCYLRAMSPIHLKYLANMEVRGSMSISLKVFGDLWGLVSCHWFGEHGMRNPFPVRKMCRLISNVASRNIERLSYASSLQAQKLINSHLVDKNASGYLVASSDDLLQLFDADFGVISILGETKALGKITQSQEALAMLEYLRQRKFSDVIFSDDISSYFKDLHYSPGFSVIAGLLYVPLSVDGDGFIALFRRGQSQEVKWGGNPNEKHMRAGVPGLLEPRTSFKLWREIIHGKSREWTSDQVELARVLCVVYGRFIQVWRQQEATVQNTRLTKLLLANSAHQVRTPLNAIINYLEIALEGTLDQETRDNLAQSHSASKSLVYVINDLLDLAKAEEGQVLSKEEIFDLPACIRLAVDSFVVDARRKNLQYIVEEDPSVPPQVYGDKSQLRQAISNVIANAIQYTDSGFVRVESFVAEAASGKVRLEVAVQDSGVGMTTDEMDGLFHDLEQVNNGETEGPLNEISDRKMHKLGLGLAVVGRIVRNMNGQLRVRSTVGQGSCFVLQLSFDTPDEEEEVVEGGDDRDEIMSDIHDQRPVASVTLAQQRLSARPGPEDTPKAPTRQLSTLLEVEPTSGFAAASSPPPEGPRPYTSPAWPLLTQIIPPPQETVFQSIEEDLSASRVSVEEIRSSPDVNSAGTTGLRILIAEDDPINIKVLRKRLEKVGHQIHHAVNGEDCAMVYGQSSPQFDVILMDMQMPIMDGLTSTQTIRGWEKSPNALGLSRLASRNGQIPIFAVSASLVEEKKDLYLKAGFDGWIPKPINFVRLQLLLSGIANEETRLKCLYTPGQWEGGGWFRPSPGEGEAL